MPRRSIIAPPFTYIPIHPNQNNSVVARMGFTCHGDHLVCPEGKILGRRAYHRRGSSHQYVALQKDCQRCPVKTECLPPGQNRRYVALTMYQPVYLRARKRNESEAYEQEMRSRHATVEGVFASLDRLGWERCKLRGLWKSLPSRSRGWTVRDTSRRLRTTYRRPCVSLAGWERQARRYEANVQLRCPNKENGHELSAS